MSRPTILGRTLGAMLLLVLSLPLTACGDADDPAPQAEESAAAALPSEGAEALPESVDVAAAVRPLRLEVRARSGYVDASGELVLDVMEGDAVYPTLSILDAEGRPVRGVRPTITPERESRWIPIANEPQVSDESGIVRFGLLAGSMGEERVEIAAGEDVRSVLLNVISQRASGYDWLKEIEGVLDWGLLFEAEVEWGEEALSATFPDEIAAKSGQTVKLAGFMMPLEAARRQSHFVLTSNPPDCFFHLPGGPAGAVEVFAAQPLAVGWDPVVLEGRFETVASSEIGVIYRLHDARAIEPEARVLAQ